MFNIALISQDQNELEKYRKVLYKANTYMLSSDFRPTSSNLANINAFIINEVLPDNLAETCRIIMDIRKMSNCFIWIMSKSNRRNDRIIYLNLGADWIFEDDIFPEELSLFVMNTLKRSRSHTEQNIQKLPTVSSQVGFDFRLVPESLALELGENECIYFTRLEYRVFDFLANNLDETVTYEQIYRQAIGKAEMDGKKYQVTNLIFHLRKKLDEVEKCSVYIQTIRTKGYVLKTKSGKKLKEVVKK